MEMREIFLVTNLTALFFIIMYLGRLSNQGFSSDMASCASLSTTSTSTAATALGSPVDNIGGYYNYGRACQSPSSSSTLSFDSGTKAKSRVHAFASPRSSPSPASSQYRIIMDLNQQITQLETNAKALYTERDFYFNKLETIQRALERSGISDTATTTSPSALDKIHGIVFNTEVMDIAIGMRNNSILMFFLGGGVSGYTLK